MSLRYFDLFAGIGGMSLGLERAGLQCVGQCEIDPFCLRVLAKHWPDVWRHDDVRTLTGEMIHEHCGEVEMLCGGFPCQDVSQAGKRIGIEGRRSGLWSDFARLLCDVRPRLAIVENTTGLLDRGFDRVLSDLAASGFDAEWSVLPACALGASHSRPRVFLVAHAAGIGQGQLRRIACQDDREAQRHIPWPQDQSCIPRELDGVPNRVERITALGNAIVPQVAQWIGRRILEAHEREAVSA